MQLNDLGFDALAEPSTFLRNEYGADYMQPKARRHEENMIEQEKPPPAAAAPAATTEVVKNRRKVARVCSCTHYHTMRDASLS